MLVMGIKRERVWLIYPGEACLALLSGPSCNICERWRTFLACPVLGHGLTWTGDNGYRYRCAAEYRV